MKQQLENIKINALKAVEEVKNSSELENIRVKYLSSHLNIITF